MYFLYILLCQDGSLYTGITNNLEKRFQDHLGGKGGHYTKSHKPLMIVYQEPLPSKPVALKREFEIKSWSRRKKIRVLNIKLSSRGGD